MMSEVYCRYAESAPAIGIAVASAIETGTGSTVGKSPARQGSPNDFNEFHNGVIHG